MVDEANGRRELHALRYHPALHRVDGAQRVMVRTVAGVVARNGDIITKVGDDFTVSKNPVVPGLFVIRFGVPFASVPVVTASLVFGLGDSPDSGNSISSSVTAVALASLDSTAVTISTRFVPAKDYAATTGQDLEFAFIAVGD
jgi:hypothetical protein